MLNSIFERRVRHEDGYDLILEIPEREFYQIYENLDEGSAEEVISTFLEYHQDDGTPSDIEIKHNKNTHIVTISAMLNYLDNDHTPEHVLPHYLRDM